MVKHKFKALKPPVVDKIGGFEDSTFKVNGFENLTCRRDGFKILLVKLIWF